MCGLQEQKSSTDCLALYCLGEGTVIRERLGMESLSHPPVFPFQANPGAGTGPGERERGSYRLRVIKALVQRYIETARREFEETRRKGSSHLQAFPGAVPCSVNLHAAHPGSHPSPSLQWSAPHPTLPLGAITCTQTLSLFISFNPSSLLSLVHSFILLSHSLTHPSFIATSPLFWALLARGGHCVEQGHVGSFQSGEEEKPSYWAKAFS